MISFWTLLAGPNITDLPNFLGAQTQLSDTSTACEIFLGHAVTIDKDTWISRVKESPDPIKKGVFESKLIEHMKQKNPN